MLWSLRHYIEAVLGGHGDVLEWMVREGCPLGGGVGSRESQLAKLFSLSAGVSSVEVISFLHAHEVRRRCKSTTSA